MMTSGTWRVSLLLSVLNGTIHFLSTLLERYELVLQVMIMILMICLL